MTLVLLTFAAPTLAQDTHNSAQPKPTRIEVDQDNNRILFFIDDELQAVLEKDRLSVNGDVLGRAFFHGDVDLKPTMDVEGAQ